jgi:hypothetical protein
MPIETKHFDEAAKYLGRQIIDPGENTRQALILTDASYLSRYTLGSVNRNINPAWKDEMKRTIRQLHERKERFTGVACIDVRHIKGAMDDPEAAYDFKAIILDSQHRMEALKELCTEDPTFRTYSFWMILYIVQSDDEMHQLLIDLDKRQAFSEEDTTAVTLRLRFIQAFKELTTSQETRRCVTGTLNHPILRESDVLNRLKGHTVQSLRSLMQKCASEYKERYEQSRLPARSALAETIAHTKLYQLINWQSGLWIREMLG